MAAYPLLTFTEWVPDPDRRLEMGWLLLGFICLVLIFNICFIAIVGGKDLCFKLKKSYYTTRNAKIMT